LHQPSLALDIDSVSHLENCELSGVPLLKKIITTWKQEPSLTHAALIERFREQPEEAQLQKLMSWNPPELAEPKEALHDALTWIQKNAQKSRVQELIDKQSKDGLTEDERLEIKNLLHQKAS